MANGSCDQPKLPEELLIEIFLGSSVESLLRAKCVCKQWYALVSNLVFVLDHVRYQKVHNKGRLLVQYTKYDTKEYNYALFDNESLVSDTYHHLDNDQLLPRGLHMEGPVNGLYCLFAVPDYIVLWNPALRESRTLPMPHHHFPPHLKASCGVIGFGVDPLTGDHKLVLIRSFDDLLDSSKYVTVYNLATKSWRLMYDLTDSPLSYHIFIDTLNSSFLNGVYYWLASSGVLIRFDMGKETFREILGPDISQSEGPNRHLTVYNDKVVLLIGKVFSLDTWVMLDEGVWIKQFSFTSLPRLFWVIELWKNDEFLFSTDDSENNDIELNAQMLLCNANTQEITNVVTRGVNICYRASIYCESLVSVGTVELITKACARHRMKFQNYYSVE